MLVLPAWPCREPCGDSGPRTATPGTVRAKSSPALMPVAALCVNGVERKLSFSEIIGLKEARGFSLEYTSSAMNDGYANEGASSPSRFSRGGAGGRGAAPSALGGEGPGPASVLSTA